MKAFVYILHSVQLDRYYTGSTELAPEERLALHLQRFYGNQKFTAVANDWSLYFYRPCTSIEQAKRIEAHIKKMKSRVYIQNLKKYPEIFSRLLEKY